MTTSKDKNLTREQLMMFMQVKAKVGELPEDKKQQYETLLYSKRLTINEALDLVELTTRPLIQAYNDALKSIDVLERLLATKFDVTEEEFTKAEKEVEEMNKKAMDGMVKQFNEKLTEAQEKAESHNKALDKKKVDKKAKKAKKDTDKIVKTMNKYSRNKDNK